MIDSEQDTQRPYVPRPQPLAIPTTDWNEAPLLCLSVNDQWAAHVYGVLEALAQRDTWLGTEAEVDNALDQVDNIISALMEVCVPTIYPTRAEISHISSTVLNGNAISWNANASQYLGGASRQSAAAVLNEWTNQVFLAAGDYTLTLICIRSSGSGILDIDLEDGLPSWQLDFYAAATTVNYVFAIPITIASDGVHKLHGKVNGKNASSSGYACNITVMYFKQATD